MKKKIMSYREYSQLKKAVEGLSWAWYTYQQNYPEGWYSFKYQPILRHMVKEKEELLLSQATVRRFLGYVKLPRVVYDEMKELAVIYNELQEVLVHPPYGAESAYLSELIKPKIEGSEV